MELVSGKVLIADDDPGINAVVQAVLSEEGFEVFTALDGEEALEAVSSHRPDVVLLDLMMPRVDGLEVCRRIRNNPSTSHMCVLMLTARAFPADKLMGLGEGADDYITKPFDPVDLASRIRTAMKRNQETALRRARKGGPPKLWDELATLGAERRDRKEIWLTESPNTVLIVDDEDDVRDVLRLHCEMQGFPVVGEAADGGEAVLRVGELLPAFVILDFLMADMDGDEAATRMRAIHPDVKIIAFSGVLTERPSWADDFLSKEQISQITPLLGRFLDMGASQRRRGR